MDEDSFIGKYKPKTKKDLVSNSQSIKLIELWIKKFDTIKRTSKSKQRRKRSKKSNNGLMENGKKMKSCLLVTGSHGVGKTTAISQEAVHLMPE